MKTASVEAALYRWFKDHFEGPEKFGNRVHIHEAGSRFEERSGLWVWPRIVAINRDFKSLHGAELENYVIETGCYVKVEPKGTTSKTSATRPLLLSNLTDEARRLVDSSFEAPALPVLDSKNRMIGKLAFGAAQETRAYNQNVSIGSVSVSGIDLVLLRTTAVLSAAKPDPRAA